MRNRPSELIVSVSGTGNVIKSNIVFPTKNEKVIREKKSPISNEYRTISENITNKVKEFKDLKLQQYTSELALRKASSIAIARSFNKIIEKVNKL